MKEGTEKFKNCQLQPPPPPFPELRCVLHVATWWMDLMASSGAVGLSGGYGT